jgi:lipooligosaccharide transport system ATP-binding protein
VVLDEPTTGLDPQVRHMIWTRLRDLRHAGKTLLLTTHYMEEAERLCDELIIMDQGRILEQGAPAALIRKHAEPEVIEVHGEESCVRRALAAAGDGRFEAIGNTFYYHTHQAATVAKHLEGIPELTFLRRAASLEDVFLKLTGREWRD